MRTSPADTKEKVFIRLLLTGYVIKIDGVKNAQFRTAKTVNNDMGHKGALADFFSLILMDGPVSPFHERISRPHNQIIHFYNLIALLFEKLIADAANEWHLNTKRRVFPAPDHWACLFKVCYQTLQLVETVVILNAVGLNMSSENVNLRAKKKSNVARSEHLPRNMCSHFRPFLVLWRPNTPLLVDQLTQRAQWTHLLEQKD